MTEQITTEKIQRLKSFAVGDSLRLIQTDERLLNAYNFKSGARLNVKINDGDLSGHYLMKDVRSVSLDRFFSNEFIEDVKVNVNDNKSEVYYNTNAISLNGNPKKLVQNNEKSYIIDTERYSDKSASYALDQWKDKQYDQGYPLNYHAAAYDLISAYVSNNYNKNYFDKSHYVNNKSVPIYQLNDNALNDLKYIRLYNKSDIDNILNKYNVIKSISGEVLFNSKSQEIDVTGYDAILIDPILRAYALVQTQEADESQPTSAILTNLFEDIFTHIPMESFYRFLNPIGLIEEVQTSCDAPHSGNEVTQYSFSIDMKDKAKDPSINYFSLKNLKNPELYQDYDISNAEYESVKSPNYVYKYNLISNIFKIYNDIVVNRLNDLISSTDLDRISYDVMRGNIKEVGTHSINNGVNVLDEVISIGQSYFSKFSYAEISNAFNAILKGESTDGIDLFRQSWSTFLKRHFKIKEYGISYSLITSIMPIDYVDGTKMESTTTSKTEITLNEENKNGVFFNSSGQKYLLFEDDFTNEVDEAFAEFEKKINEMLTSLGVHFTLDDILPEQTFTIKIGNEVTQKTIRTFLNFDDSEENLAKKMSEILKVDEDDELRMNIKMAKRYPEIISGCQMFKNFMVNEQSYIKELKLGSDEFVMNTVVLKTIYNQIKTCSKNDTNGHSNVIYDKLIADGLFKPGVYYKNLVSVMNEISKINGAEYETNALMRLNYPEKYESKIADYKSTYEDMFERENEMTVSGILYGKRRYNDAFISLGDDLNLVYNYDTRFDKSFLKNESIISNDVQYIGTGAEYNELGDDEFERIKNFLSSSLDRLVVIDKNIYEGDNPPNSIDNVIQRDLSGNYHYNDKDIKLYDADEELGENNELPAYIFGNDVRLTSGLTFIDYWLPNVRSLSFKLKDFLNNSLDDIAAETEESKVDRIECLLFRLTDNKMIVTINNKLKCMLKMLNAISKVDFVDNIKGQHYYKENTKQKSNVFSLNVRNSGLNYKLYSYDEMNIMCKDIIGYDFSDIDPDKTQLALEKMQLGAILPTGKLPTSENTDYKSLKYYSYGDDDKDYVGRVISVKMELRKTFEDAIRKSIHRYVPVNTVLWKIDYTED